MGGNAPGTVFVNAVHLRRLCDSGAVGRSRSLLALLGSCSPRRLLLRCAGGVDRLSGLVHRGRVLPPDHPQSGLGGVLRHRGLLHRRLLGWERFHRFLRGQFLHRGFLHGFHRLLGKFFHRRLLHGNLFHLRLLRSHGGGGIQHPSDGLLGHGSLVADALELHRVVEHVELDLHGLLVGGVQHGLLNVSHILLDLLAALHADAMLLGVRIRRKRGHGHGSHHAKLIGDLLLIHTGGLNSLRHPAAALPLEPLEIGLHLLVDGLFGVVKEGLVGLLLAGQLSSGVISHAVLVDGLELDAIVHVVLVFVEVRHALFSAK